MNKQYPAILVATETQGYFTKNIILKNIIPVDGYKIGDLCISVDWLNDGKKDKNIWWQPQYLIITSDEPIGMRDWYLDDANQIRQNINDDADYWASRKAYKKIICSNHPSINNITLSDLKWWVENLCPDVVSLEMEEVFDYCENDGYEINNCEGCFGNGRGECNAIMKIILHLIDGHVVFVREESKSLMQKCAEIGINKRAGISDVPDTNVGKMDERTIDVAELKKAIIFKNEGWANSLQYKIWSLAYENNSEELYQKAMAEIAELNCKAAHFGYQLNRQVIDWEKLLEDFLIEVDGTLSNSIETYKWFRSRISASSDGWISVKDKLPEVYKDVNAWRINKEEVLVAIWNGTEWEMNDEYDTQFLFLTGSMFRHHHQLNNFSKPSN